MIHRPNQLELPRGFLGQLAGRFMAIFNAEVNRAVVESLDLRGEERVLEVGFGPGVGIGLLCDRLPQGQVSGVDPSPVMLRQAAQRNRGRVARGQVDLRLGQVSRLEWEDCCFDAVISINNVHLWYPLAGGLAEVWRVLKPQGRVLLALHDWAAHGLQPQTVARALSEAGFQDVVSRDGRLRIGRARYFSGRRA